MDKEFEKIKQNLINGLKNNYDLEENVSLIGEEFDLSAQYNIRNSKFVMTKKVEIYAFRSEELLFFKGLREIDSEYLEGLKNRIKENIEKIINVDKEHMNTDLTFIFVVDELEKEMKKKIKRFKYHKSFKMGLKGWTNVKLFVYETGCDLLHANGYANTSKKEMNKVINA